MILIIASRTTIRETTQTKHVFMSKEFVQGSCLFDKEGTLFFKFIRKATLKNVDIENMGRREKHPEMKCRRRKNLTRTVKNKKRLIQKF